MPMSAAIHCYHRHIGPPQLRLAHNGGRKQTHATQGMEVMMQMWMFTLIAITITIVVFLLCFIEIIYISIDAFGRSHVCGSLTDAYSASRLMPQATCKVVNFVASLPWLKKRNELMQRNVNFTQLGSCIT
jgi:hypothetical protein